MDIKNSPVNLRHKIRHGKHTGHTSGYARGYVQCNMVILPKDWSSDFLQFCQFNPKPCPLLGVSEKPGDWRLPDLGEDLDVRTDISSYRVYSNGELIDSPRDIIDYWRDDLVAFALGCSFSFEEALIADGLDVRNVSENKNVPMYRTSIPCRTTGRFGGSIVATMRPFLATNAIRAIQICTRFPSVHGAPIHLGDPSLIGISNLDEPDFGDSVTVNEHEIPVFWACGVTPQVVVEQSKPPFCITQGPGDMLVTDMLNSRMAIL